MTSKPQNTDSASDAIDHDRL